MYNPKGMVPVKSQLSRQQRLRRSRNGIIVALLVLVLGAGWAMWKADKEPSRAVSAERSLIHDLQALWSWSESLLAKGAENAVWSIRWNTAVKAGSMNELATIFFTDKNGDAIERLVINEGKTITGVSVYGGKISVSLVEAEATNAREQIMILYEAGSEQGANQNTLLPAVSAIGNEILKFAPTFTSSIKVQGFTLNKYAIEEMVRLAQASVVDRFEDGGTISQMLYTHQLQSNIVAGGGRLANIQIGLHKQAQSENVALTIGIPIINGEYSSIENNQP